MNFFIYFIISYVLGLFFLYAYLKAKISAPPLSELMWTGILSITVGIAGAYALYKLNLNYWVFIVLYGLVGAYLTYKFLDGKK
jgi:hypothetical protein